MNKDAIIKLVNEQLWTKGEADVPQFKAGDTITVSYKIVEGNKERVQSFRGVVIQIKGSGKTKMFTIRKISNGVGVERIFPLYSPHIEHIEVNKVGVVRRARIYYLRKLTGKKARIKEKRMTKSRSSHERKAATVVAAFLFASVRAAAATILYTGGAGFAVFWLHLHRPKSLVTMEIKGRFDHFNINVTDLDRSLAFYREALGLHEIKRKEAADGSFVLAYLGDDRTGFRLELTWLRDHAGRAYELGENESHLCLRVEGDYDAVREYHRSRGWVCYENHDMGLYFINDPDDYWIEVLPVK